MYVIERLDWSDLDTRETYTQLVGHEHAQNWDQLEKVMLFGARHHDKPIGLLLANTVPILHIAEIKTLYVDEEHRCRGIAKQLITHLQKELIKESYYLLLFPYKTNDPYTPVLEHIVEHLGWPKPQLLLLHCKFDGNAFHPPWLTTDYPVPEGFEIFPWKDLAPHEHDKLERQEAQKLIPTILSPVGRDEHKIEMLNSVGLRHKGTVIGWMITYRDDVETIRYTKFFIQRAWQMKGIAITLLCEAIKRQQKVGVPWAVLDVSINETEPSWLRFVERRLIPYAHEITYTKQAWLELKDEGHKERIKDEG